MSSIASSTRYEQRHTDLLRFSGSGKENEVFTLLDSQLWSTQTDKDVMRQALQRVAGRGNLTLAEHFVTKGAEVNVKKERATTKKEGVDSGKKETEQSALYLAARGGHTKVVEFLVKHGASTEYRDKDGRTALFAPFSKGFLETVRALLTAGANVDARDKDDRTMLINAAAEKPTKWMKSQSFEIVQTILKAGANINAKDATGRSALSWAASTGNETFCRYLLSGASGQKADIRSQNKKKQTALHLACVDNNLDVAVLLLSHGADPMVRGDGRWTSLHMAAQRGHEKIVRLLVSLADDKLQVNCQLTNGMTALHWAAFQGHEKVVDILLERDDLRLDLKDTYDRTALLCAAEAYDTEIRQDNGKDLQKYRNIIEKLSPSKTGHRLPEAEKEASRNFKATVVDFGHMRNDKRQLVDKEHTVYDLLYGWDNERNKPKVDTQVKQLRRQAAFRWIHFPANNVAWVETLLAKAFVEGGYRDIEDFKALEKCFNQEHRGPEAHAHFMRPYSQRYAISTMIADAPEKHDPMPNVPEVVIQSEPMEALPEASCHISLSASDVEPPTPTNRKHSDTPGSEGKKRRKSNKEVFEERHGKTQKRRNGPPGDSQKKKHDVKTVASKEDTIKTLGGNGKIVLYMPYLHYESSTKRQDMADAIQRARDIDDEDTGEQMCPDEMLIQAYLNHLPPLHVRRTLDQFFYHSIDTSERDTDQVVYRHFKRNVPHLEPMVFMVDQLWMFVVGKELVITCFPQRWDQPANDDPLNVLRGIIEDMNAKTRPPVESVYDLAMLITGRCSGVFDRHRLENEHYQFLDMFEVAIGQITDQETIEFKKFKSASAETKRLNRVGKRSPEFAEVLFDISMETKLLTEIKDIQDELNIISMILEHQQWILPALEENILQEIGGKKSQVAHDIERKMKEQVRMIQGHCKDIDRMKRQTENINASLTNLLDLKQKHANALEARYASTQSEVTARQGQTILVFTIVTIIFLPMSFIAAFFAINMREFEAMNGGQGLAIGYVSKFVFGIGLGVSVPLVIIALAFDNVGKFMRATIPGISQLSSETHHLSSTDKTRTTSDLESEFMKNVRDKPRVSNVGDSKRPRFSVEEKREESNGGGRLGSPFREKQIAWDDVRQHEHGLKSRVRRESRASKSSWTRAKISFDRRRKEGDVERGAGDGQYR